MLRKRFSLKKFDGEQRSLDELKKHYVIEKELANRLRSATKKERKYLYSIVYDELFQKVYNHPQLKRKSNAELKIHIAKQQMQLLKRFLKPETRFLEVGAGDCSLVFEAAKFVKVAYGVDVSREITNNDSWPSNFNLIISDGCSVPVPGNSIDVIYSDKLMEHLHPNDALEQLKNIYKALVPRSLYLCVTPNSLNGPHDISKYFDEAATGFHLKEYTTTELASLFKKTGFSKVRVLIGARGLYFSFPKFPIKIIEAFLQKLSISLRKTISRCLPFRIMLGIKIIGIK